MSPSRLSNFHYFITYVVTCSDYLPFGQVMPNRHGNDNQYRYGYQGSEKDDEIKGNGNSYTTEFRQLDVRIGRWLSYDPKDKAWESPYASMGNNPIWFNDQLGDDYGIKIRKKEDKIKSVTIQATVYIQGAGASEKRAKELNKEAKNTFKTEVVEGVEVNIKINYIFDESKKTEDLKLGENLLLFSKVIENTDPKTRSEKDASHVNGTGDLGTAKYGIIFSSGKNNHTVLHESLHFLGLSDRYIVDKQDPNYGKPCKGYENDIMGSHSNNLSINHYKNILDFAKGSNTVNKIYLQKHNEYPSQFLYGSRVIDKNNNLTLKR